MKMMAGATLRASLNSSRTLLAAKTAVDIFVYSTVD
jgi:hypothetical protein